MVTSINLLVILVCVGCLYYFIIRERRGYEKQIRELKQMISVYDTSERVIKNCVVYTPEEPVTINGERMAFIGCTFEQLGRNPATKALRECLGLK
jgi:hypothetical protein